MWLILAFTSAALLGLYDVCKKHALRGNVVLTVLWLNTLFCSLLFLPSIVLSATSHIAENTLLYVPATTWMEQRLIMLKAVIVLSSWICGYYGMKWLPLTIVGPINATRPVMVLVGAMLVFGERLNIYQWIGVTFAIVSFFLLSRSGKKEGIDFRHNRWIVLVVLAAMLGAVSGLYDKYLMAPTTEGGAGINRMAVQSYYNIYQLVLMTIAVTLMRWHQKATTSASQPATAFHWTWSIPLISLFLSIADFAYFYALSLSGAMISVVSMIRRGSVVVSFFVGAMVFNERNLWAKVIDLALVLLGMLFLYLGSA
ncbi:MAG: DMT family transporter [Bacteroidaceae bacterium]|nr:DMT family transporter [Bacteroidaceae bacterium]